MKITLIDYTGKWVEQDKLLPEADYAAAILIFTKSTRLEMKPGLMEEILDWPYERKMKELEYMANTIPSSWEFCHYTFMIEGVTRAFTHQLVRTRTASFAQQTMRVLNVEGWDYATGPSIEKTKVLTNYHVCMADIAVTYDLMIARGAKVEDARGVLPTNILTNIVMGANLRTMAEMIQKRSSSRTQGEYRNVLDGMKAEMLRVHPWTSLFFDRTFDKAALELDQEIADLVIFDEYKKSRMIKLLDQLRKGK